MAVKHAGQNVNKAALCVIMGVSPPTVDGWVRNGCPITQRGSRGVAATFNTADVMKWLRDKARDEGRGNAQASEEELKLRKLAAEAEKAELEVAKAKAEVAPVREFERATAALMAAIRTNVLNVTGRAVLQLLGCTDELEFKRKLRAELTLALETAADTDLDLEEDDSEGLDG